MYGSASFQSFSGQLDRRQEQRVGSDQLRAGTEQDAPGAHIVILGP